MRFQMLAPVVLVAAILVFAGSAQADPITPALSFGNIKIGTRMDGFDAGWAFSVNSSSLVTALGFIDLSTFGFGLGTGVTKEMTVTIWTDAGTLLASAIVPAGTAGTLIDGFRYVNMSSALRLDPGNYVIGSHVNDGLGGPLIAVDTDSVITNPLITFRGGRECCYPGAANPSFPNEPSGANGDFGPNMLITAVPAPNTLTLLIVGMAGFVFCYRRRTVQ
ncbi:MAG TPA: hypothetical protein VE422_26500 [Terriglobia bacterium]|nr:hypothetical protein [Terriglobia bacterium]